MGAVAVAAAPDLVSFSLGSAAAAAVEREQERWKQS
jgi:hypothetical protein